MADNSQCEWIRPSDVMKLRRLKAKKYALKARFSTSSSGKLGLDHYLNSSSSENVLPSLKSEKRRNPFRCTESKNIKLSDRNDFCETSSDGSLFHLFDSVSANEFCNSSNLTENTSEENISKEESNIKWVKKLHIDWSLRSRVRFCSVKPFQWKQNFKTSEEASGTTGFVRCLNVESAAVDGRTVDTSTNAQFYQCCLLWQHPNLPHVSLFPRDKQKLVGPIGIYGSDQAVVHSLHSEWGESLRSLYQLLRVRQCPYFYVCCNSFTCLFRAAGAAGFQHTHALITPTTRGFREALKKDGVEFSMPLFGKHSSKEETDDDAENIAQVGLLDNEEPSEILETLGLQTSQFPSLNQSRVKMESKKFQNVDGSPYSLVYVEDMELQGLINFMLNCGSCTCTTGPMAGIPPTLLSPVAFLGGTLKSLKISGSSSRTVGGQTQYSIDVQGPIMPSTVLHLISSLSSTQDSYSVSLSSLPSTLPFCSVTPTDFGTSMPMAFANEGLVDCGLGSEVREAMCKASDTIKSTGLPLSYREITYDNGLYTWADRS